MLNPIPANSKFKDPDHLERSNITINPGSSGLSVPKEYQGLLDANPYRNQDYNYSGWQRFLNFLGFRTGADKRAEDLALQASEYDANVLSMMHQEQYDSAAANVARERAAGLNPDLIGADQGGASRGMPEDTNPPAPTETDMQTVSTFANVLMTGVSFAFGLAKDVQALNVVSNEIESGQIENSRGLMNLALDAILGSTPENPMVQDPEHGDYIAAGLKKQVAEDAFTNFGVGLSKRSRMRFKSAIEQLVGSIPATTEQYKLWRKRIQDRKSYFQEYNGSDYGGFAGELDGALSILSEELGKLNKDVIESSKQRIVDENEAASATANNEAIYQGEFDPAGAAQAANEQNKASKNKFQIDKIIDGSYARILARLEDLASSDRFGHRGAEILLLALRVIPMLSGVIGSSGQPSGRGSSVSSSPAYTPATQVIQNDDGSFSFR